MTRLTSSATRRAFGLADAQRCSVMLHDAVVDQIFAVGPHSCCLRQLLAAGHPDWSRESCVGVGRVDAHPITVATNVIAVVQAIRIRAEASHRGSALRSETDELFSSSALGSSAGAAGRSVAAARSMRASRNWSSSPSR